MRRYKSLAQVERAFRSLKTIDLKLRPVHHSLATRFRAHIFPCTLAYHIEWHMREAWRELMFADEEQNLKNARDPVAPARRSPTAEASTHMLADGTVAHSFSTLLAALSTIVRSTCQPHGAECDAPRSTVTTMANAKQQCAFELLRELTV